MILHLIKPRIQIVLAVVAMATLVPMTAFPQANEGTKEVTSSVAEIAVGNTQQSSGENNTNSGFSKNSDFQTLPNVATNFEVEVQTQFNEIRRELLDDQASSIHLWLAVIGIILTFFGVVVVIAGFMGYKKFREIEAEGKASVKIVTEFVKTAEQHLLQAEHLLQEILNIREEAAAIRSDMDASFAAANPTEAYQTVTKIRDNPAASPIEKVIADALALQQQGKQEDAIKKWRAIAEITEESDNELAARAWFSIGFLSSVENITKEISSYDRAIQLKPDMAIAYFNRGHSKSVLRQDEDAITDYDKVIQLKPDMAEAYSNRGNVKRRLGRYENAIEDFDKAIQLNPNLAEVYSNRGLSKSDLERHENAIEDFDKAIQLNPNLAEAYFNRGVSKSDLRRHENAIIDYDKAIQLKPDYAKAYTNRGNLKSNLGWHEDAIADFDKAIQLNPDVAVAYFLRGLSKSNLGWHEDAIIDYDKAIQLKPDYAVAYSKRGLSKSDLRRHEDAIIDYDKAIQLKPDYAVAYSNRGHSKSDLGRHEDAITDYDKAIRLNPNLAEAHFNRGKAKYELGFKVEAKSDLEIALKLARNSDNVDLIKLVEQNLHSLSAINGD